MFIDFINIHDNNMLNDTSKKEKKKLQTTIRRIREDAEKKRHGEEHSRGIKR